MACDFKKLLAGAAFASVLFGATAAQATVYYTTTLFGSETVVGTVLFEQMGNASVSQPSVPGIPGDTGFTTNWNVETNGNTYGVSPSLFPPSGLPGPLNPFDITGTTQFNDYGIIPDPIKGFMLAVIANPGTSLETANGVPDTTWPLSDLHLVMMINGSFASADAVGKAFGTGLAGGFSEDTLITDILNDDTFYVNGSNNTPVESAVYDLESFANQNGAAMSFGLPGGFEIVSFSNGTLVGNGIASFSPTPEPATWAMFLMGFGAIGWILRGSHRKGVAAAA